MQTVGLHHVALNVDDVGRAVAFYTDVLGLRLRPDRPDLGVAGAWLDAGGQQVHLLQAAVPENRGQHFAMQVEDVHQAVAELRALGVGVSDPSGIGDNLQAFLLDPSGNPIELHQVGSPRR